VDSTGFKPFHAALHAAKSKCVDSTGFKSFHAALHAAKAIFLANRASANSEANSKTALFMVRQNY